VKARGRPFFVAPLIYVLALGVSVFASPDLVVGAIKWVTQVYLLMLALLAFQLFRSLPELKTAIFAFLVAGGLVGMIGALTVLLFPWLGATGVLDAPLHHYGTLKPGPYPRIETTFTHPAMLTNFLGVAIVLLLASRSAGWIGSRHTWLVGPPMIVTAFFALTPGFGGFLLALALFVALAARESGRFGSARLISLAGFALLGLSVLLASATPFGAPGATVLADLPLVGSLFPSVRWLAWNQAIDVFLASPMLGSGLGNGPVEVPFQLPSGVSAVVSDAHNMFLNIAGQSGLVGLAGLVLLIVALVRHGRPFAPASEPAEHIRRALALAVLCALIGQGLVGSFEDARHLWIAFGLMIAAVTTTTDQALARGASLSSRRPSGPAPQPSAW